MCLSFISNSKLSEAGSGATRGDAARLFFDIVKFLAGAAFLYSVLLVIAPRLVMPDINDYKWHFGLMARDLDNSKDIDVLVLGSSHVYRSFDPRVAKQEGINMLNVASPLQTPFNSYYLLKDIFDGKLRSENVEAATGTLSQSPLSTAQDNSPKNIRAVVVELYEKTMRADSGVESYVKSLGGRHLTAGVFLQQLQLRDWSAFRFLWYKVVTSPFSDAVTARLNAHEEYVSGGFLPSSDQREVRSKSTTARLKKEFQAQQKECESKPKLCEATALQLEYLEKIVQLCRQHGVPLIFVSTPMAVDFVETSPYIIPVNQGIAALAEREGIPFLTDFRPAKLDMYSDYLDATHLNGAGAKKFTEEFLRQLKNLQKK